MIRNFCSAKLCFIEEILIFKRERKYNLAFSYIIKNLKYLHPGVLLKPEYPYYENNYQYLLRLENEWSLCMENFSKNEAILILSQFLRQLHLLIKGRRKRPYAYITYGTTLRSNTISAMLVFDTIFATSVSLPDHHSVAYFAGPKVFKASEYNRIISTNIYRMLLMGERSTK